MKLYEVLHYSEKGVEEDLKAIKDMKLPMLYLFEPNCPEFIFGAEEHINLLSKRGMKLLKIKRDDLEKLTFKPLANGYEGSIHELINK